MPYNSGMYKLKNLGNYDAKKNPNNNEKLYEITLNDGKTIVIKNLNQVNFEYKYIVLNNHPIGFKIIKEIK